MTNDAVTTAPVMLCVYCSRPHGFSSNCQKLSTSNLPLGRLVIGHRVLHPGIGHDDEEAGDPRAAENHHGRKPMHRLGNALLAIEKKAEECRLEEEAEDAFHCQRLADHAAGDVGKSCPVGAELELHGNAGDHAEDEVDGEDPSPEAGGLVPLFTAGSQRTVFRITISSASPMVSWGNR